MITIGVFNIFKKDPPIISTDPKRLRYLETVFKAWYNSKERNEMLLGEKYYMGDQDILYRQMKMIGQDGVPVVLNNVVNNKLVDNQYKKMVDQKTNYALGKPITIATDDDKYLLELNKIFDKKMFRRLRRLGKFAVDGGIAWVYPFYNEDGFQIRIFPSYEICPVWSDNSHEELDCAIRVYDENIAHPDGGTTLVHKIEVFGENGIDHYRYAGGQFIEDKTQVHQDYMYRGDNGFNWERIPIIPFRYNEDEIPLIRNIKGLQDALNQVLSDFQNNMEESPRTSILVLKNYDGTDLASFRQNLATYGVVKVHTVDGVQGGVDTLRIDVSADNYQALLMQLKRAIVENGRGFDAKEERMDGDPNQMNIESMYTDIDLDVNGMESEFQAGFEQLIWFINQYLIEIGKGDFTEEAVEFVFNRDIFINEGALIDDCVKSVGIISNKTIVSKHPFVVNLQKELDELEREKEQLEASMSEAFTDAGAKKGFNDSQKKIATE